LQEGDIQIRGFKLRLNLDIQFVFTANPEDYTNRGSIVTPLKDRIGSQILTHYPEDIETARKITEQEAKLKPEQSGNITLPDIARDLLEQVAFEARENEYIDAKSGVSARLTITALENLVSAAERRMLVSGSENTTVRLLDFLGIIPAITGKVELVYEGEQEGSAMVAENLIGAAVKTLIEDFLPSLGNIKSSDAQNPYNELIEWFSKGNSIDLLTDASDSEYQRTLDSIKPMERFLKNNLPHGYNSDSRYFIMEMVLWALAEHSKLNKERLVAGFNFSDLFSSYLRGGDLDLGVN
jgi:magnesium chelatase subunit I